MFFGLPEYHLAQEFARIIDHHRAAREEKQHEAKSVQQTAPVTDNRSRQPDPCAPATQPGRPAVSNL